MDTAKQRTGKAYSYMRFSSGSQAYGHSFERQEMLLRQWLALDRNPATVLDTELTFKDKATSAFLGEKQKELAKLLEHIEKKQIPKGSYLVVESLDRLTRQGPKRAMKFFLELNEHVRIVVLSPYEREYDANDDNIGTLMEAMSEMGRSHGESKRRSDNIQPAWERKQELAAQHIVTTTRVPEWLDAKVLRTKSQGGYLAEVTLNPEKAIRVRRVFRMALDGYGIEQIVKILNRENYPPISNPLRPLPDDDKKKKPRPKRGIQWTGTTVGRLLRNRAVIGEFQAFTKKEEAQGACSDDATHTHRRSASETADQPLPIHSLRCQNARNFGPTRWHAADARCQPSVVQSHRRRPDNCLDTGEANRDRRRES